MRFKSLLYKEVKLKSLYIVALGVLIQVSLFLFMRSSLVGIKNPDERVAAGIILGPFLLAALFAPALGILPLFLFLFERTKKFAAVLSVILGALGLVSIGGFVIGVFLIIAGISYLRSEAQRVNP